MNSIAVIVELQNTGDSAARAELAVAIEQALSDRPGDWTVSMTGPRGEHPLGLEAERPCGVRLVVYAERIRRRTPGRSRPQSLAETGAAQALSLNYRDTAQSRGAKFASDCILR